jgi:hypothetical protein
MGCEVGKIYSETWKMLGGCARSERVSMPVPKEKWDVRHIVAQYHVIFAHVAGELLGLDKHHLTLTWNPM